VAGAARRGPEGSGSSVGGRCSNPAGPTPLVDRAVLVTRQTWNGRQAGQGWTDRDESRWPVPFWHIDNGMAGCNNCDGRGRGLGALLLRDRHREVQRSRGRLGVPDDTSRSARSRSLRRGREARHALEAAALGTRALRGGSQMTQFAFSTSKYPGDPNRAALPGGGGKTWAERSWPERRLTAPWTTSR